MSLLSKSKAGMKIRRCKRVPAICNFNYKIISNFDVFAELIVNSDVS